MAPIDFGGSAAPLEFLLLVFAGWVNRRQREVVEYLQEENRVVCASSSATVACGSPMTSAAGLRRRAERSAAAS
ncbi:MAG: hypothetical protein E6J90_32145 [Deltaproteobacteria bacterium]|nr:MAG: hypothetical protein E6J90_32145 [Deltaproteobacteria bacterium]TMQ17409.1 MAG: hypothetical protein E6J91_10120 [Deltaproteobacteria bacterium]